MSEDRKKKMIVLKKKGEGSAITSKKPVIQFNKPPAEKNDLGPATEQPAAQAEERTFKFYCVYCGQKLSASSAMTGRSILCPSCRHQIEVPHVS